MFAYVGGNFFPLVSKLEFSLLSMHCLHEHTSDDFSFLPTDLHLRDNTIIYLMFTFSPWHTEILQLNYIAYHSKQFILSSYQFSFKIVLLFFTILLPWKIFWGHRWDINDKTNKYWVLGEQNWLLQFLVLTQQNEWHSPLNRMGLPIVSSVGDSCIIFTNLETTMRNQIHCQISMEQNK